MKNTNDTKPKKALWAMIPVRLPDLNKQFPKHRDADRVRAILQLLFFTRMYMKANPEFAGGISRESGYCPIRAKTMKAITGNRYRSLISKMIELNIIQVKTDEQSGREKFMPHKYSKLYRVHPKHKLKDYKGRSYRRERITDESVITAVKRHYENNYREQLKAVKKKGQLYSAIVKYLERFYIDTELLIQDIDKGSVQDDAALVGIANSINDKLLRFCHRDEFGKRLHTQIGNMPKALRPYLRLKDKPGAKLIMMDIVSSQPYLLSLLFHKPELLDLVPEFRPVRKVIERNMHKPDTRLFYEDCCKGEFYNKCMLALGDAKRLSEEIPEETRRALKEKLFRHIFYSSPGNYHRNSETREQRHQTETRFGLVYPSVLATLKALKRTRRKTLPFVYELTRKGKRKGKMYATPNMLAQRFESRVVLELISGLLFSLGYEVATIHDAFLIEELHLPVLQRIVDEIFINKLGVKQPKFKITKLSEGQQ